MSGTGMERGNHCTNLMMAFTTCGTDVEAYHFFSTAAFERTSLLLRHAPPPCNKTHRGCKACKEFRTALDVVGAENLERERERRQGSTYSWGRRKERKGGPVLSVLVYISEQK